MKKTFLLFTTLCYLFPVVAEAADDKQKSFFNSDFFSLSKKKESAFDAPSAVYVLSSEDIRRSGATSIPEALRMVPGLQVSRIDGNKWSIGARGFNRQYSNKLLIMIDGRTVYTPIFSGAFWDIQDYVIEDIEKIEVIRGPGGTIWGANAVNGIINIITKNASETQGSYLSQTVGNKDVSITEARYGGKTASNDAYRLYAKHSDRRGFEKVSANATDSTRYISNNDGIIDNRAGFKYDMISLKDNSISVHGDFYDSIAKNYFNSSALNNPSLNDKHSTGGNLVMNWSKTISKKSSFTLQTYLDYAHLEVPIVQMDEKTVDVDFQHFYNFSKENQFIWGLSYRNNIIHTKTGESVTSTGGVGYNALQYTPSAKNFETFSAFIQDKIGLIPDTLYLTLGSKFQNNTFTGFEYQPNARLTYYPSRNQTIWTAVSRAVRVPTYGEQYLTAKFNNTNISQGSRQFGSESVVAYELGYRVKPTAVTTIDIASFYNDYSKLRTYDGVNGVPTAANNGYGESYGFEIDGKWQVFDSWRVEASYDFLKMTLHLNEASNELTTATNGDPLEGAEGMSPRNQFRFRSLWNVTPKLEFDNMFYYVSALSKGGTANTSTAGYKYYNSGIPAYTRWDTRLGYLVNKNLDLSLGVQNLLDNRHQEFTAGLFNNVVQVGRTYYVKAALQF